MHLVESRSLNVSLALHIGLALIAFVGLPALLPTPTEPTPLVMTVEVLPITGVTNVKPSDKPIEKKQEAPTPKTPKPVEPSVTEPLKAPEPEKPVEKTFDPMEKAEPVPDEKPKPKEEKQKADDFAALLNKLKQENTTAPTKTAKDKTNTEENKTKSDAPYDPTLPMSLSETDAIRGQFIPCWRIPMGSKDAASLAVHVKVELIQDGSIKTAIITADQQARYGSDPYFRAAADSALRAVHKCSPLKNLPPEKFNTWKEMTINFDPKDML